MAGFLFVHHRTGRIAERERVYCTWVHLKLSTWYGNKYDDIWLIYGQLGPTGEATAAYCSKTRCVCCAKAIRSKVRRRAHAGHPKSGRHGVAAAASGTVSTPIGLQVIWSGGCRGVWVIAIGTPAGTLQEQIEASCDWFEQVFWSAAWTVPPLFSKKCSEMSWHGRPMQILRKLPFPWCGHMSNLQVCKRMLQHGVSSIKTQRYPQGFPNHLLQGFPFESAPELFLCQGAHQKEQPEAGAAGYGHMKTWGHLRGNTSQLSCFWCLWDSYSDEPELFDPIWSYYPICGSPTFYLGNCGMLLHNNPV